MGKITLSLAYMRKMRELGYSISHLCFNRLIILHSCAGRKKAIPKISKQMRADNVTPHVSTFNILIKIKANQHNTDRLVNVYQDMKRAKVKPNEISFCILGIAHTEARLYSVCEAYIEAIKTGQL